YLGYTLTDAKRQYLPGNPRLPLTPEHRLVSTLTYEVEGQWKLGAEGFFTGHQLLDNNQTTPTFWTFDFVVQRIWKNYSLLLNLENFTDTRQTRFSPIYTGTLQNPVFNEVYAPLDGRIISLAFKYTL